MGINTMLRKMVVMCREIMVARLVLAINIVTCLLVVHRTPITDSVAVLAGLVLSSTKLFMKATAGRRPSTLNSTQGFKFRV